MTQLLMQHKWSRSGPLAGQRGLAGAVGLSRGICKGTSLAWGHLCWCWLVVSVPALHQACQGARNGPSASCLHVLGSHLQPQVGPCPGFTQ